MDTVDRVRKVLSEIYANDVGAMARDIGVNRSTCSRYKNGQVKPNRRSLASLSQASGVSLAWLMRGPEDEIQYISTKDAVELSLRDRFALAVLPAVASGLFSDGHNNTTESSYLLDLADESADAVVVAAVTYRIADALMEERKRPVDPASKEAP